MVARRRGFDPRLCFRRPPTKVAGYRVASTTQNGSGKARHKRWCSDKSGNAVRSGSILTDLQIFRPKGVALPRAP